MVHPAMRSIVRRRRKRLLTMRGESRAAVTADSRLAGGPGYEGGHISGSLWKGHHRAIEGKLPLRQHAIRGQRGARRRDTLHLFVLLETRRAVGLLHASAVSADLARGERGDLSVADKDREAQFLRRLRLRHLLGIAGLVERQG